MWIPACSFPSNMNMGVLNGNQMGSMGEYFFRVYLYLIIRVAWTSLTMHLFLCCILACSNKDLNISLQMKNCINILSSLWTSLLSHRQERRKGMWKVWPCGGNRQFAMQPRKGHKIATPSWRAAMKVSGAKVEWLQEVCSEFNNLQNQKDRNWTDYYNSISKYTNFTDKIINKPIAIF